MKEFTGAVVENRQVAYEIFEMVIATDMSQHPYLPGQFVHVQIPHAEHLLLRRPISFHSVNKREGTITLIIQRKNEGTQRLCELKAGAVLDMLGGLGRGFTVPEGVKTAAMVGGGVGIAPLRALAEKWPHVTMDAYFGYRTANLAYNLDIYKHLCQIVKVATEDGTLSEKGFVTAPLSKALAQGGLDAVYVCGPLPMIKAVKKLMADYPDIPCQVSMEERMGCGVGGCRVCTCKVREGDTWHYQRVCQDGPVFSLSEVEFDG